MSDLCNLCSDERVAKARAYDETAAVEQDIVASVADSAPVAYSATNKRAKPCTLPVVKLVNHTKAVASSWQRLD